jgi:hypothetical protein
MARYASQLQRAARRIVHVEHDAASVSHVAVNFLANKDMFAITPASGMPYKKSLAASD